jgi:hypothetical protein
MRVGFEEYVYSPRTSSKGREQYHAQLHRELPRREEETIDYCGSIMAAYNVNYHLGLSSFAR